MLNEKYINWSEEKKCAVISLSLNCPANCIFCYRKSLIKNENNKNNPTGDIIANFLCEDHRFHKGINGTKILIGGFSDPLHENNIENLAKFILKLESYSLNNIVHIATRFCTHNQYIEKIFNKYKYLIVNLSVNSLSNMTSLNSFDITRKIHKLSIFMNRGIHCALYIKPIIPGLTIRDVPVLIEHAKMYGIKYITIGNLFYDQQIKNSLEEYGAHIDNATDGDSHFILDENRVLTECKSNDMESIKKILLKSGFTVFPSSIDLANFFIKKFQDVNYDN